MSGSLCLNGTWDLYYAEGVALSPGYLTSEKLAGIKQFAAAVPAPIHTVLCDAGLLPDLNYGMNSLAARWVEEMYWVYRRSFTAPAETAAQVTWLEFDKLELDAVIFLNGEEIGKHTNAHRPAVFDVTGKLRAGENSLVVQLSSGMHSAADKPVQNFSAGDTGLLTKRPWHRHPQYQSGWDWNARLVNIGILGDVRLTWSAVPRLTQATVFAVPGDDLATATFYARASIEGIGEEPVAAELIARIAETGQEARLPVQIAKGESRYEVKIEVANPRLWWPRNHGEQFCYTVDVSLAVGGETQCIMRKTGVRKVEMDQSKHPVEGRYCILKINNRPIFCKGGNWVPADLLYSTVTPERYRELVDLAVAANFNTLRIWGGALFADHALCDYCDELGILIWHDFLFACAKYPGDDPAFAAEVRKEVTFATRDLAHHPSLVVWCGNNEIEWGDWSWGYDNSAPAHPHYAIFHRDIPKIVTEEDPSTLHWISSPWSPEYKFPNDPTVGDQHPWEVSIMDSGGADWWKYRAYVDRFPNEGGVLGASSVATLKQFLPEHERSLYTPTWVHHDNPLGLMGEVGRLGRAYSTVELWTGRDPLTMEIDEYAYVSGLLQAEGLREYITNYRRRMYSSASAIFWMYNDSWPVTHGWTIVDYYRRRKLAYHPVRRAFQPVTVVVAEDGDAITVYGVNDTPQEWAGTLRSGFFLLAGSMPIDEQIDVVLQANASTPLATYSRAQWEALGLEQSGAFAVLLQEGAPVAQHRLFVKRFHELAFVEPDITLTLVDGKLTLTSDAFAWGVCLDVDGERALADNCVDLLPGIPYVLPWDAALGEPKVLRVGNSVVQVKVGV